jgi:hypothetical protein
MKVRFVYHSRLPAILVPFLGISGMIAFCVFAIRVPIPDPYLFWLFVVFFALLATGAFLLFRLLDRGTHRVENVVFPRGVRGPSQKSAGTAKSGFSVVKKGTGEFHWEIGVRGLALIPHWIISCFFVSLGAILVCSQIARSRGPGDTQSAGAMMVCMICAVVTLLVWTTVVRFRIDGSIVTIERPFALLGRRVSFCLSEIDQVDLTHWAHDRRYGECLTFTLHDGKQIRYSNSNRVVGKIVRQLKLAIERSREVPHPLSDDAIR